MGRIDSNHLDAKFFVGLSRHQAPQLDHGGSLSTRQILSSDTIRYYSVSTTWCYSILRDTTKRILHGKLCTATPDWVYALRTELINPIKERTKIKFNLIKLTSSLRMPPIVDDLKMNNVLAYQSGRFGIRIADQEHCLSCDQKCIPVSRQNAGPVYWPAYI